MSAAFVLSILSLLSSISFAGGAGTVGPGNPATIFCSGLEATSIPIKYSNGNEARLCAVGGAVVEEFTLMKELKYKVHQEALAVFAEHPHAQDFNGENASSQYCLEMGGTLEVVLDRSNDNSIDLCSFSDGSAIEVETLYRGPSSAKNKKLMKLLLISKKN